MREGVCVCARGVREGVLVLPLVVALGWVGRGRLDTVTVGCVAGALAWVACLGGAGALGHSWVCVELIVVDQELIQQGARP
jgi:hypothetical protein